MTDAMPGAQHIYAILRSQEDWASVSAGEPHLWCYDRSGSFRVEPEVFGSRAGAETWVDGGWGRAPTTYPVYAIKELAPPSPTQKTPRLPHKTRKGFRRQTVARAYEFLPEVVEQIDALCEAYRLRPSAVIARLISDAYRRDVVESGLLDALVKDDIIAPLP